MTRLITWCLIIAAFGLGLVWMVASAQANPRTLPTGKPAEPPVQLAPSLSEQAGAATRSAIDKTKEVSAQVVEKTSEIATQVGEATKEAAAKTSEVASEAAKQASDTAKQAAEKAKQAASEFSEGFNKPVEPAKP